MNLSYISAIQIKWQILLPVSGSRCLFLGWLGLDLFAINHSFCKSSGKVPRHVYMVACLDKLPSATSYQICYISRKLQATRQATRSAKSTANLHDRCSQRGTFQMHLIARGGCQDCDIGLLRKDASPDVMEEGFAERVFFFL